jgi:hypothetical protein
MSANLGEARPELRSVSVAALRKAVLWLFVVCGATALVEPSPYEFMFVVAVGAYARGGLSFDATMAPLVLWLALLNAGGLLALVPFTDDEKAVMFVAISIYMAMTAIFFAAVVAGDPLRRIQTVRSGYVVAGLLAATFGILGYFNVAGLGPLFTLYDNERASGPFKDPNVFGPFLITPVVWIVQDLLLGRTKRPLASLAAIGVMTLGVFLSFSRGAWGDYAASIGLLFALTLVTSPSPRLRRRIATSAVAGLLGIAVLLAIALSVPEIRAMFFERFSLNQYYDMGETGRFGDQARSVALLLERFFGFGPLQFRHVMHQDPHEVYLNAFASYGWLGGLSFFAFTASTLFVGWRLVFTRGPFQAEAIPVWSCLFAQMVQGLQIDTDHWRHLYLLFGLLFGLASGDRASRKRTPSAPAFVAVSPHLRAIV